MQPTIENLLSIIHEDGGHYLDEHGLQKAFDDAVEKYYKQRSMLDNISDEDIKTPYNSEYITSKEKR